MKRAIIFCAAIAVLLSAVAPAIASEKPRMAVLEFKNKVRLNSAAKGSLLAAYSDEDIEAMSRYLAGY